MISEYGLLPSWVSSRKLRSAIGQAGKTPGAFDKFQTFASRSVFQGTPGVVPDNPGNPDIRPETTTELEGGVDAGVFGDRLGFEGTVYRKHTRDAIVPKPNAPSNGFASAARVNIGAIRNTGWEASVNYLVVSRRTLDWTANVRLDGNHNEVTDLGGVILAGNNIRLGYPVRGVWSQKASGFSVKTGGSCPSYGCPTTTRTDTAVYFGPPLPTFTGSFGNTLRVGAFQLYGLVSMERGAWFSNGDRPYRVRQGGSDEYLQFLGPNGARTFQADSVAQYCSILDAIDSRDNVRLLELSLSWTMPARLSNRLGVGRTLLQLSGQNLMWWDHCHCVDPNMNYAGGDAFTINSGFLAQPSPRQVRIESLPRTRRGAAVGQASSAGALTLTEAGFYEARPASGRTDRTLAIAVNVDPSEADPSRIEPAELVRAVAPDPGQSAPPPAATPLTRDEREQRQGAWWWLLLGALVLLAGETLLSNRLTRRRAPQTA